ncbi:FAD binding domain-containing protein [Irregularibacter muris]|uniref:FAD binding domain-containing protein n=1 Tax=Irregularibacter muris TaxID=1796619 RepID=A0AAE3L081_9FIRM|nr:FAD binding domain-containing protein [Irregularibacter muris]MCR1899447.1 FAD binding domain-containing protein [Irregularibacter muris]
MKNIDYSAPKSVEEAVEILKGADQGTQIIAGGTDIIIQMNRNIKSPQKVVDIKKLVS